MASLYFATFWIPAVASVVLLYVLGKQGDLYGRSLVVFLLWFIASTALQLFARNTVMWIVGLATQAALATWLAVKWDLSL